jgi:tRNA(Ile)-lysidine synthase
LTGIVNHLDNQIMNKQTGRRRLPSESRGPLSKFARRLLVEWKELGLPTSGGRVVVAVSGGADSTALLLAVDELLKARKVDFKLIVAHLDHAIRKESREDARWVSWLAEQLGYKVIVSRVDVKKRAKAAGENLEQAARRARYDFFKKTATKEKAGFVLTAHTLDDQAETILMRLLRGSAAEGLSGTEPVRPLDKKSPIQLARPLLSWARRSDTEDYCRRQKIVFRVDEMNDDYKFSRVRIRKQLLPLMQSFNNRIVDALGRTATLLREDAAALAEKANELLEAARHTTGENSETNLPVLRVDVLAGAPAAVRRRALRQWLLLARGDLHRLEMVHLLAVERLLESGRGGRVAELPGGAVVTRKRGFLELSIKNG